MHKFVCNYSVHKFKHLSLTSWITENTYQNVTSCCGIHTVSKSNTKSRSAKGTANKVINFDEIVTTRRAQAQRSILLPVQSEKSFSQLQKYYCQYGTIVGGHHYKLAKAQFILVEYSSQVEAQEAIKNQAVTRQRLLAAQKGNTGKDSNVFNGKLMVTDGCSPIDYKKINEIMLGAESLSDQMAILFRSTKVNDLGTRLRFFAARQIEELISGLFPSAEACIFGSSMNGFGKLGCDLDLVLQLDNDTDTTRQTFSRTQLQEYLKTISKMMRSLPGIIKVYDILGARVPIIKYQHQLLGLEVDLSMYNMSGLYMSEVLHSFTLIDDRVQPLVYTIRRWAQTSAVTRHGSGRWVSNFSLTCLVIFYLQQLRKPVLPTISLLVQQARPQDKRISDEERVTCTFLRDLNVLQFSKENTDSLDQLLMGFFEYYSLMDFDKNAISLNDAQLHTKRDESAMYVINPLEQALNVTKIVDYKERERFRTGVRNALWSLESTGNGTKKGAASEAWGLLNLLRECKKPVTRKRLKSDDSKS